MKLSKSTELAIHGLYQLASDRPNQLLVAEMAESQKVSPSYLAKVFQKLARKGLVNSTRGKKGGFRLAMEPDKISMADVVRAVEAEEPLFDCLKITRCCEEQQGDCVLRKAFEDAEQSMYAALSKTTLADILESEQGQRANWT